MIGAARQGNPTATSFGPPCRLREGVEAKSALARSFLVEGAYFKSFTIQNGQ